MFETMVVRESVAGRRYRFLTLSLTMHTLVIAAMVAASLSSVRFPREAPDAVAIYMPAASPAIPPPLGTQRSQPAVRPDRPSTIAPEPRQTTAPPEEVPQVIPDTVAAGSSPSSGTATGPAGGSGDAFGDPNGHPDGVDLGQPAEGTGTGTAIPDITFAPGGEVKAATVLHRVEPEFPRMALAARMSGVVVLRCVIGKRGEVRDVEVVQSSFAAFEKPALDALRQWKFAPGSMRGQAVDTWFELTMRFYPR